VVLLLLGSGCVGFTRTSRDAREWRAGVKTLGVLSAIGVYEIHPGGIEELHDEWTAQAAGGVMAALQEGIAGRGLPTRPVSWKGDAELDELRMLYAEVASAIFDYTYYPFPFPTKRGNFDYEVGPIGKILDRAKVDALLIAAGRNHVGANGRRTGKFQGRAESFLSLGLIERGGKIAWFDLWAERGLDIRRPEHARKIVDRLLRNMPGGSR
jgi:hypothetical protein